MPKKTAAPMALRISEPAPVDSARGATPMMNAMDVIKIGRSRNRQASRMAFSIS